MSKEEGIKLVRVFGKWQEMSLVPKEQLENADKQGMLVQVEDSIPDSPEKVLKEILEDDAVQAVLDNELRQRGQEVLKK